MKTPICPHRGEAMPLLAAVVAMAMGELAAPSPAAASSAVATTGHTAVAAAASSCPAYGSLFYNPFTYSSAHHRPIGSGAVYAGVGEPTTQSWLRGRGSWRVNSNNGWGRNVFSTNNAPIGLIKWSGEFGVVQPDGEIGGLGLPARLHLNADAANGRVSDSIVILVNGKVAHEFYRWWNDTGTPTAAIRRDWSTQGTGYGSSPSQQPVGVSASGIAGLFGLLRGFEINTPGQPITHVLTSAVPPTLLSASAQIVWPATHADGCAKQGCTSGTIPYGALFALPPPERGGPDLSTLGLSQAGLRLAAALRDYGTYIQDKGGNLTLPADQQVSPTLIPALNRDLNIVQPYLRMVKNNVRDQDASGGGSPRAPNCAFDAP